MASWEQRGAARLGFTVGTRPSHDRRVSQASHANQVSGGFRVSIRVKRVYESPSRTDGFRVLVDRLWPRGVSKDSARIDWWAKELAPSAELRRFFGHDPKKWPEFRKRYFREITSRDEPLASLRRRSRRGRVTLVFGAKEERFNNAVALKEFLEQRG